MMRVSWLASLVLLACLGLSGTVGATTLTEVQLAAHGHPLEDVAEDSVGTGAVYSGYWRTRAGTMHTGNTGSSKSHTHSLAASTGAANGLPPYYSLAYIMRVA